MRKKLTIAVSILLVLSSCGIYKFTDTGGMDFSKIKTVKINFIENKASYVNPQLAPKFTEKIQQKILTGTKLTRTQNDDAGMVISGTIINYDPTQTVSISAQQATVNRLTVTLKMSVRRNYENGATEEFNVSRSFDFPATQSLQAAEGNLLEEVVRTLTDEIFNHIFSNW